MLSDAGTPVVGEFSHTKFQEIYENGQVHFRPYIIFFFKQKTAYEIVMWLEFRRVLFRSISNVSVEYQMTIKTYHLVPLVIELYSVDGETEVLDRKSVV